MAATSGLPRPFAMPCSFDEFDAPMFRSSFEAPPGSSLGLLVPPLQISALPLMQAQRPTADIVSMEGADDGMELTPYHAE